MNDSAKYDIAVIGAGPAGSTAALYLNRYGFNVCLIEKKVFPRETLCGEFLSREVLDILADLNMGQSFFALNPNPIYSIKISDGQGNDLKSDLGFTAYGLKRGSFDNLLLTQVKGSGVDIFQPAEVKTITRAKGKYLLSISSKVSSLSEITADNVIAAFGKQSSLDKYLKRNVSERKTGLNGVKFHIPSKYCPEFSKGEIQIHSSNGIYCGVNTVNDNTITVCFLENKRAFKGSSREHLKYLMEKNKSFNRLFDPAVKEFIDDTPIYGVGNIYFGRKTLTENGIIKIGDAARVIAPLAGDGISMAMQSAKVIADIMKRLISSQDSTIARVYEQEWKEKFSRRIMIAKLIQAILLNNKISLPVLSAARMFPSALGYIIRSTRG